LRDELTGVAVAAVAAPARDDEVADPGDRAHVAETTAQRTDFVPPAAEVRKSSTTSMSGACKRVTWCCITAAASS